MPTLLRTLVWLSELRPGAEYLVLWRTPQGYRAHGEWVGYGDGGPSRAGYRLDLDAHWGVRRLHAVWRAATTRTRLHLVRGRDGWQINGQLRPDLAACDDVDLAWTPLTNTLPIRRLGLAVGAQRDLTVAYVATPELTVAPDGQRYTRLAAQRWRYTSLDADFTAELTVDDDGLVLDYPPLFRRAGP